MTSFIRNWCPFAGREHDPYIDEDGNERCRYVFPGKKCSDGVSDLYLERQCAWTGKIVCNCRLEPDMAKYVGCPTHCKNPRLNPYTEPFEASCKWLPEDMGGYLTEEEADRLAAELIHDPPLAAPATQPSSDC